MKCLETCRKLATSCPVKDCRHWIKYEEELNCVLESVSKNGSMTLRETASRLNVSYVRVKQIQDKTINKLKESLNKK
jgi:hypothetical protein|tara:strand:+ start:1093 stop:1323 length:231 start_codon:yes stop_codon:yes gene_type:complete